MPCGEISTEFNQYKFYDPFPDVDPALLNGYDIERYISTCKIVEPSDPRNVKSATYKVPLYGEAYFWDEDTKERKVVSLRRQDTREPKDKLKLKPNSITYIHIDTVFRVPYYMAFRFNLTVSLAHKGLLLGTGPIVDPGFEGRIMIPVHNLTANEYDLDAGIGLIRVEFTKLSNNNVFASGADTSAYDHYLFPDDAKYWCAERYFDDINCRKPIISSIPTAMNDARKSAKNAEISANKAKSTIKKITIAGTLAVILATAGIILPTISLVRDSIDTIGKAKDIDDLKKQIDDLKDQADGQNYVIADIASKLKSKQIQKKYTKEDSNEKSRDLRRDCVRQNDPCEANRTK